MTDVSPGPGWWIASDGRWYPPHLRPAAVHAPASPQSNGAPASQPAASAPVSNHSQWGGAPWSPAPAVANYPPGYGPPPGHGPPPGVRVIPIAYPQDPSVRVDQVLQQALSPWWKRFLAFVIDTMIILVAGFIVLTVIGAAARNSNSSNTSNQPVTAGQVAASIIVLFLLLMIPCMLYFGIMNGSKRGQTLGKMALSIVVRDARSGGPIGFWRGVGRYAITALFFVLLVVPYLIDNLSPLYAGRRQAWHDRVVHSIVVDRSP
jgi:uncharacterized RDD family membrane protein YckC